MKRTSKKKNILAGSAENSVGELRISIVQVGLTTHVWHVSSGCKRLMAPFQLKIEKSQKALNNICTDRSKCPFDLISITAWLFSAALNQVPTERQKYGRALALTSYRHYHTNEGGSRQNLSASERANKPTTLRRVQCRTLAHAQPFSSSQPGDIWRFTRGRGNYI